jgi:hypothetical protein
LILLVSFFRSLRASSAVAEAASCLAELPRRADGEVLAGESQQQRRQLAKCVALLLKDVTEPGLLAEIK